MWIKSVITANQAANGGLFIWMARALKEAVWPSKCLVCRSFFQPTVYENYNFPVKIFNDESMLAYNKKSAFHKLMRPFLCSACSTDFVPVESPFCCICGIMFKSRIGDDHVCGECIKSPKKFRMARTMGVYEGALMKTIQCLKYKGKIQLARPLGMLLFFTFIKYWNNKNRIDLIVPVPLHIKRFRKRGFNQAYLLIREWFSYADAFNVELSYSKIEKNALIMNKQTESQTGLDRKQRQANIKNAFSLGNSSKITGESILLIDDVYTTGATADECAKVLIKGGAKSVDVLTLARGM
ncbi:MAG: ComF family protein [Deltaproteobacteria bacterium]|nr:ComF family protein [Deltaproteobacteria bacterium]